MDSISRLAAEPQPFLVSTQKNKEDGQNRPRSHSETEKSKPIRDTVVLTEEAANTDISNLDDNLLINQPTFYVTEKVYFQVPESSLQSTVQV